jgi:hypothetical protein
VKHLHLELTISNQHSRAYESKNRSASPGISYLYETQKAHYQADIKKKGSCYISMSRNRLGDRILITGPAEIHDAILL